MENQSDYSKNILKFSSIPPSKMEKEMFLGIVVCSIFDKTIIRKNLDLKVFIEKIFKYDFKDYLYKSRTLLMASLMRKIYNLDFDELQEVKIRFFKYFDEINLDKQEPKGSVSKWLKN